MYIVSRTQTFAKLFFVVSFSGLFMYVALAFYSFHTAFTTVSEMPDGFRFAPGRRFREDTKFILIWTAKNNMQYHIEEGQTIFLENNCGHVRCYITTNRNFLNGNYKNFDAIVFNISHLKSWSNSILPRHRSPHQKYVFYSRVPANNYPICNENLDNYFNWTWTYKFGSDIFSPFIEVKDKTGVVVAPRLDVKWTNNIDNSTKVADIIEEVNTKTKAVVWIMKDCEFNFTVSDSLDRLSKALEMHSLFIDIYGCGNKDCPEGGCLAAIRRDYYFYLTYENSFSVDYVTDEVLLAYEYDAVPIVFGAADYAKFLPDGSYINYQSITEENLAELIAFNVRNSSRYREYFSWKKLYTLNRAAPKRGFCDLCYLLNSDNMFKKFSTYGNFRKWWNNWRLEDICPKNRYTEFHATWQ